jgi:hypothetical protein
MEKSEIEENIGQFEEVFECGLPGETELIITKEGLVILDEEGPIRAEEIGETKTSVLCGC